MDKVKVLFYLVGNDSSVLIELKKIDYNKNDEKNKYLSWFRIDNKKVEILNFLKMNENTRFFEQGKIYCEDNDLFTYYYGNNEDKMIFKKSNPVEENVKLCLDYWNKI